MPRGQPLIPLVPLLVHEGDWTITGNADGELTFTSPYGREVRSRPQPLAPGIWRRAADAAGISADLRDEPPEARAGPAA